MLLTNTQNNNFKSTPFTLAVTRQRVGQGVDYFRMMANMQNLSCSKCRKVFPTQNFYKTDSRRRGYSSQCKSCIKEYRNRPETKELYKKAWGNYYALNKARLCQESRKWSKENRGKANVSTALWRKSNPKFQLAHNAVAKALRAGTLTMQPCEVCGIPKTEGHHDDYAKPLDVRWLCNQHHHDHHNNERRKDERRN